MTDALPDCQFAPLNPAQARPAAPFILSVAHRAKSKEAQDRPAVPACIMKIEEAYEVVKGPLMALIGGSLAISKDLIPLGDTPSTENRKDSQGGNESEPEKPAP